MGNSNYQPFLKIVETYQTSNDLKCIKEILKFPEDDGVTVDFRNLIIELQMTKWVRVYTEETEYPDKDPTKDITSNVLEKKVSEVYVYDFHYFGDLTASSSSSSSGSSSGSSGGGSGHSDPYASFWSYVRGHGKAVSRTQDNNPNSITSGWYLITFSDGSKNWYSPSTVPSNWQDDAP